jgi:AcrR family transcriptional regulator
MPPVGLRERKNAQTRAAIERAAFELALEQGFERTSVDQIAERADVSPRTVFGRYRTKEAIVFGDAEEESRIMEAWLDEAEGGTIERVAAYIREMIETAEHDELARLRLDAMLHDPALRRILRGRLENLEAIVIRRLAGELGLEQVDVRVRMCAAGVTGLLLAIADRAGADPDAADPIADLEEGVAFLHAGLGRP